MLSSLAMDFAAKMNICYENFHCNEFKVFMLMMLMLLVTNICKTHVLIAWIIYLNSLQISCLLFNIFHDVEEESVKVGLRREDALCRSVECWNTSDCCWVEVNLVTLTCGGYYQIFDIGVSLPPFSDCWVEVNLVTLTCGGYYQIFNIGLSLPPFSDCLVEVNLVTLTCGGCYQILDICVYFSSSI